MMGAAGLRSAVRSVHRALQVHRAHRGLRRWYPVVDSSHSDVPQVPIRAFTSSAVAHSNTTNPLRSTNPNAWDAFASHLQALHDGPSYPMDQAAFDELYGSIAERRSDPVSTNLRHEQFNKLRVLTEYAEVYHLSISDLQRHHSLNLFVELWEISMRDGEQAFIHAEHRQHIAQHCVRSDATLASRLVKVLASAAYLEDAEQFIDSWLASSNERVLHQSAWHALLQACLRADTDASRTVGLRTLQRGDLRGSGEVVKVLLARCFTSEQLVTMAQTGGENRWAANARSHVLPAAASILLDSGDTTLARSILETASTSTLRAEETKQLFAQAASVTATQIGTETSDTAALQKLETAMLFFRSCDWSRTESGCQATQMLITSFRRFVTKGDSPWNTVQSVDRWRGTLRSLLLSILEKDPALETFDFAGKGLASLGYLIHLLVSLRDYKSARLLFNTYEQHRDDEISQSPFLAAKDFQWMFQAALYDRNSPMQDSWSLFMHWLFTDLRAERMPYLPPNLVRQFIRISATHNDGRAVPLLLQHLHLEPNPRSRHNVTSAAQSSRLIAVLLSLPPDIRREAVPVLSNVLAVVRQAQSTRPVDVLNLHISVLWRLSQRIEREHALDRAQCLAIFEDGRRYARSKVSAPISDDETVAKQIIALYLTALRVMRFEISAVQQRNQSASNPGAIDWPARAAALLDELQDVWQVDLAQVDRESTHAVVCSSRILIHAAKGEWKPAIALYDQNVDTFTSAEEQNDEELDENEDLDRSLPQNRPPLVSATVACRLALALGRMELYKEARGVLSTYLRVAAKTDAEVRSDCSPPNSARALLESADVALMCMQGHLQEALDRIYSLYRLGVLPPVPSTDPRRRAASPFAEPASHSTPVVGPSNESLAKIFAHPLLVRQSSFVEADWHGELLRASQLLVQTTQPDRSSKLFDGDDGERFFSNYHF